MPPADDPRSPSADDVRAALERMARSATFERSAKLPQFLSYICEVALQGEGDQINEYRIGVDVFGRSGDYSPSDDSIVRRQAHLLRQKLLRYYQDEGKSDPVRIDLPVGRYVPVFRRQGDGTTPSEPPASPQPASPPPPGQSRRGVLISAGAGLAVAAGAFALGRATASRPMTDPVPPSVRTLWTRWRGVGSALLCLSNPMTARIAVETASSGESPTRLVHGSPLDRRFREVFGLAADAGPLSVHPDTGQGKLGEAAAAVRLAHLCARLEIALRPTESRFLTWETLVREHALLLGHNGINVWVDRLLAKAPLRFLPPTAGEPRRIVDQGSGAGDSWSFTAGEDDLGIQHALISMLPGVDGRRELLLLSGLNSQATDLAAQLLTSEEGAADLLERLSGRGPHFQAVVRAEVRDRVPTRGQIVHLRAL